MSQVRTVIVVGNTALTSKITAAEKLGPTLGAEQAPLPLDAKPKPPETYQERVEKMSDRQLLGEVKRHNRQPQKPLLKSIFTTVLQVMMENYQRGMRPYIR